MRFKDYHWNFDSLRAWAFENSKDRVPQDFVLVLASMATVEEARFFLDLAADLTCPQRDFFLACLYMFVAQHVRENLERLSQQDLEYLLRRAEKFPVASAQQWVSDSRHLLADPQSLHYDDWFFGHLTRYALEKDLKS